MTNAGAKPPDPNIETAFRIKPERRFIEFEYSYHTGLDVTLR